MHVLDFYALNTGLRIGKPYIMEKFYPLSTDKFISIYPYGNSESNKYSHWREVCRILFPILSKENISMIQMGPQNNPKIEGCLNLSGKVGYNQCHYLIRHSLLHVAVDSFTSQFASSVGKKVITLYGDRPPENNGPFWSSDESRVNIVPETEGRIFSYHPHETENRRIDFIKPEQIAKSICELLNINFDYPYRSLNIGKDYNKRNVESVPSLNPIDISNMSIDSLILRADLNFSEQSIINQLKVCSCSVVTGKPININILLHFRDKIKEFIYLIDGVNDSLDYVKEVFAAGVKCHLMSEQKGAELNRLKLKYLDYGPIHTRLTEGESNKKLIKEKDLSKLYYKSSRSIIYNAQPYYCEAAIEQGITIPSVGYSEPQKVIDNDTFWKESDKFIILEKI
jgi:hypothetical protein